MGFNSYAFVVKFNNLEVTMKWDIKDQSTILPAYLKIDGHYRPNSWKFC